MDVHPDDEDDEREPEKGCERDMLRTLPVYGIDQTKGPINVRAAELQHHRMEAGL